YRSAIASSLLQVNGYDDVSEFAGGVGAWELASLPVVEGSTTQPCRVGGSTGPSAKTLPRSLRYAIEAATIAFSKGAEQRHDKRSNRCRRVDWTVSAGHERPPRGRQDQREEHLQARRGSRQDHQLLQPDG